MSAKQHSPRSLEEVPFDGSLAFSRFYSDLEREFLREDQRFLKQFRANAALDWNALETHTHSRCVRRFDALLSLPPRWTIFFVDYWRVSLADDAISFMSRGVIHRCVRFSRIGFAAVIEILNFIEEYYIPILRIDYQIRAQLFPSVLAFRRKFTFCVPAPTVSSKMRCQLRELLPKFEELVQVKAHRREASGWFLLCHGTDQRSFQLAADAVVDLLQLESALIRTESWQIWLDWLRQEQPIVTEHPSAGQYLLDLVPGCTENGSMVAIDEGQFTDVRTASIEAIQKLIVWREAKGKDLSKPGADQLSPDSEGSVAQPESMETERHQLSANRDAIYRAYKRECTTAGIKVTLTMVAQAANPDWNDPTPVKRWKSADPRSTPGDDVRIRAVFVRKPHLSLTRA